MAGILPINIRAFLESLRGKTEPLTEKDFSEEELEVLRQAAYQKYELPGQQLRSLIGRSINYPESVGALNHNPQAYARMMDKSYETPTNVSPQVKYSHYKFPDDYNWLQALMMSLNDPAYRIATTLGNYGVKDAGDHYQVYDTYNWGNDYARPMRDLGDVFRNSNLSEPTSILNALADLYAPKTDRPVDIKLKKK